MQDDDIGPEHELAPGECELLAELGVMVRLLHNDTPDPWTRGELERDADAGPVATGEAIDDLARIGLVHVNGELVTPTKAARRMHQLDDRW